MRNNIIKIALLVLSIQLIHAQNASDTLKMTLQECIDYALKNSDTIKNANLDEQIANAKVGEVRAIGLPQVAANFGIQHNLRLRDIFSENSTNNPFSTRDSEGTIINEGKIGKIPNFFQLNNGADASLSISQLIFSGSYIVGLQAANTYKELSKRKTEQTVLQTKSNVTKAYYMALVNLERINLFNNNISTLDSTLEQTKKLNKQGFVETIDIERLEVTMNNLITEKEKFTNMMLLSNVLLKYQMGMPIDKNLVIMDKLGDLKIDEASIMNEKVNYNNRIEYQTLLTAKRIQELDLKNNRWARLPSIKASADLGVFTQNKDLNIFSSSNFANQAHAWSKYGLIQLGMSVPIFGGFSNSYKTQQSKLNVKKADNNLRKFEQVVDLQTKKSELTLRNSIKSLKMQERNMNLAQNVANVTQKKYKQGVGSNLELISAQSALKEAQINYYNSLFDAITSKVDYDLAVGNFK